ncbi:Fibronectin type-III domain-containing protein 3a [Eumeta japonica]|uniref:Fibronectin type-III domain-containing protein 3a n=1 Tax=Eumeta variegata TaxID=151549 RepID=A0A4C1VJH0_EUMVA|nr:Fibronectin type-III domain-containing protein 3a [Eumeta japonica]
MEKLPEADNDDFKKQNKGKGPANGAAGPQQYYSGGYAPHYHHMAPPPPQLQHSPPPPPIAFQKDERTQRQYSKLKQKLEKKQNRNNGIDINSNTSTPSLSPRKELNGSRGGGSGGASSGAWSEGEGSSASASLQGDDDNDTQAVLDLLSATRKPQVSEMTPTSALVQWNSPLPEGVPLPRHELTYDLLLGDRGRYKAIYSGPSLSCRVRDLRPGCEYSVCLQIRAGELTGAASEAATFRAPAAPPDRPAAPRVTQRARTSLLLRWTATADNGARILHYLLEMNTGEGFVEVARPRTRQHTANNLQSQTLYRFRIAAVNEVGKSDWSDELTVWTTGAPPAAPQPPELQTATPDSLALIWKRRTQEEEFTLQMDDRMLGHGFLPVYAGHDLRHVCTGLRRATEYRFRLRCETADGQGSWSAEVIYPTLPERPAPPGRPVLRGKAHARAFRLKWDAPVEDGGSPIASYTLELDGGEGYRQAYTGPEREAHCDRLQPGTPYRARVCCENEAGLSDWSPTETVTTDATHSAACPAPELVGKTRATSAAVRWRQPDCDGGTPITEYRVEVVGSDDLPRIAYSGIDRECILRDLSPGHNYKVRVTAYNRVGASVPSPMLEIVTAPAPPDAPAMPIAFIESPNSARLEWTAPRDNGAQILDYRLEMSSTNVEESFSEIFKGIETSYIVRKLTPFSPYFFRVSASNAAGRGAPSGVRDVLMPRAPPAAPTGIRHEATADSLHVHWKAPVDHGAEIVQYKVEVDDSEFETEGIATEYCVEGLLPDTIYRVRVAALNELGVGEWSEPVRLATRPPPPRPPRLECVQRAHNYLKIKWGEGTASESTQYCLEMRALDLRDFRVAYRGSGRSFKVKKLKETTAYAFRIRASDDRGGRGEFSDPVEFCTTAAPPPALRAPTIELSAPRTALVEWESCADASFVLQCARAKDALYRQVYAGGETRYHLEELEHGCEYLVRVCAVRAGLAGAWSSTTRIVVPALVPTIGANSIGAGGRARRTRGTRTRLEPRQTALLILAAFVALALLVAVGVQRLVEPRP